jgi:hypothetical protein
MSDQNKRLDDLLKSARVPGRSWGYWENFPGRVMARLSEEMRAGEIPAGSSLRFWGFGVAAIIATLILCIGLWMRGQSIAAQPNYTKLYREIESMFPNQVRAIVVEGGGVRLELSDKADIPSSSPLRVDVCNNQQCRTYITFSGQRIRVNAENWDVLADGGGHVVVVGPDIVWTSAEPTRRAGAYHIDAKPMGLSS